METLNAQKVNPLLLNNNIPDDDKKAPSINENVKALSKKAIYLTSLAYTLVTQCHHSKTYRWWNPIKDTHLILGAIPLKNKNHHIKILNLADRSNEEKPKLSVLTLLEPFEIYSEGPFSIPVTPKDWKDLNVDQKIISAADFKPLSQNEIKEAVLYLEKQNDLGYKTYVHCKAGRGRSATAVVCYLIKKYGYSAETAKEKVKECRSQISLNTHQWRAIKTYETSIHTPI